MIFGQRLVYQLSAQALNAMKARQTAAAVAFSLIRMTLFLRSHSLKSLLRTMATSVTFTPNITVSKTSLSSIGELQKLGFHSAGCAPTMSQLEKTVKKCLDDVELKQICQ